MNLQEKLHLVKRNAEEIITLDELTTLLENNKNPRAYWGFECSGLMHIGMGLVCGSKIKDMVNAGFQFIIFLADWHSWINNKLGGDLEKIRVCGEYIQQSFTAMGIKADDVQYLWTSDLTKDIDYWEKVIRIGKSISLQRTMRALPIMGREMSLSDMETAWMYYPCMQAADIFHMKLDVACAGMDQRKVHMLARDVSEKLGWDKPSCVHTHLLMGLQDPGSVDRQFDENATLNKQISSKMSKSIPGSCVFMHDQEDEIKTKMKAAYCPPRQARGNPVLELAKYVVFVEHEKLVIPRPQNYGGSVTFQTYDEMEKAYLTGQLHPMDLKNGVADALIEILRPVREYFDKHPKTLSRMMEIEITR